MSVDVRVVGVGHCLPGDPIPTADALRYANISCFDEAWVEAKLGIRTRHSIRDLPGDGRTPLLKPGWSNSELCARAAREALDMAGVPASEVDLLLVATCTPDYPVPATSTYVQEKLGLREVATMDVRSACCGAFQAFAVARQFLLSGTHRTVLVCAADVGTMWGDQDLAHDTRAKKAQSVNWLLIGDAAGAMVLRGFQPGEPAWGAEVLGCSFKAIGAGKVPGFYMPAGGCMVPVTAKAVEEGQHYFAHNFREVLEHGQELYWRSIQDVGRIAPLQAVDLFIPHQANGKIAEFADKFSQMLGVSIGSKLYNNFSRVGNTANASTYLSLSEVVRGAVPLPDGAVVALLGAESTKWLFGSIVLRYHPMDRTQVSAATGAPVASMGARMMTGIMAWTVDKYFQVKSLSSQLWRLLETAGAVAPEGPVPAPAAAPQPAAH